ncbi:HTTM domain-containing protein [Palleronia sp. KMU-117]|uniref:HTTM domain-containing protein n=1 Tax=Palleronia sp. KMU-117 TaxID=3434108 RepID=UPI003D71489F
MTDAALTPTARSAAEPLWRRAQAYLSQPVAIQSLAVTRILFGAIMVWDCYRYIKYDRIFRYYVEPTWNFPYFGLDFIRPLPEPWIHWAWLSVGVFAFLVMIGAFYRVAIIGFTLVFGYFFLLDKTQYLNHNYMVLLYAVLLCFAPAGRAFSVDAWRRPETRMAFIPRWPVAAIRLQTEIILIYAGIVKITDDWLRGEPLGMWLRAQAEDHVFGWIFQYDWVILMGTWGTIGLHILGAPLLLWRRTRLAVFLTYCVFHMSNSVFFNIGIFPWLTIAITLIFFDPDWPQQLARRALGLFETLPPMPRPEPAALGVPALGTGLMAVLAVWFAVQIAVPQRQIFFPNLVGWTGDGHRFSWRMRIYDRKAEGVFVVHDPARGVTVTVDPFAVMSARQARAVLTRTDLIHDFAQLLEAQARAEGMGDVEVRAQIVKSLNGRPRQLYVDPEVDLTAVAYNWLRPDPWVRPLETRAGVSDALPDWLPPWPQQRPWEAF